MFCFQNVLSAQNILVNNLPSATNHNKNDKKLIKLWQCINIYDGSFCEWILLQFCFFSQNEILHILAKICPALWPTYTAY